VVTITENGRQVRTMGEVLVRRLAHDGIKGNEKGATLLLRTQRDCEVVETEAGQGAFHPGPQTTAPFPTRPRCSATIEAIWPRLCPQAAMAASS
jgi:hypothetical protein